MTEVNPFPANEAELEILKTTPPTPDSLRLATQLGLKLGENYIINPDIFSANLAVTIRGFQYRELRFVPGSTFDNFAAGAFAARSYMRERVSIRRQFGSAVLESLDEHELSYTESTNSLKT